MRATKSAPTKRKGRARRQGENWRRSMEDRMLAMETMLKKQDRHFGRLIAPFVGMPQEIAAIRAQLAVNTQALDNFLKQFSTPQFKAAVMVAAVEAEG